MAEKYKYYFGDNILLRRENKKHGRLYIYRPRKGWVRFYNWRAFFEEAQEISIEEAKEIMEELEEILSEANH